MNFDEWCDKVMQLPEGHDCIHKTLSKFKTCLEFEEVKELCSKITETYLKELENASWEGNPPKKDFYHSTEEKDLQKIELAPFSQKIKVPSNSKIGMIGDIHGSVHSLMRNLIRMNLLGYFDQQFRLKNDFYLIFLGDLSDRGYYGIETW
jgi:hypothetical protein